MIPVRVLPMLATFFCFSVALGASAQTVPDVALGKIAKTYTDKGMKLEQTFVPDAKDRTALFKQCYCYPGKTVTVVSVIAAEPKAWLFKVRYNDVLINRKDRIQVINLDGANYWLDKVSAYVPAPALKNNSNKCMTILAYDKASIGLPVYLLVFTKD